MVAPVTGPHTRSSSGFGPRTKTGFTPQWFSRSLTWYRQKRPYNLPLAMSLLQRSIIGYNDWGAAPGFGWVDVSNIPYSNSGVDWSIAYNKAYDRFKSQLGESTELSVSLAERRQAMGMITNRFIQLTNFSRHLRKLQFGKAANDLGLNPTVIRKLDLRRKAKSFGNNYLEFHFGWSPLIADIGNAVGVLQGGVPPCKVSASASIRSKGEFHYASTPPEYEFWDFTYKTDVRLRAMVAVADPNLWLANSLGFVNPATIAWELVPFSFVVDWFVNVSDFLSGYTDFLGLSIFDVSVTSARTGNFSYRRRLDSTGPIYFGPTLSSCTGIVTEISRYVGALPGPSLRVRQPWRVSPRRGLAAASLLIQSMR